MSAKEKFQALVDQDKEEQERVQERRKVEEEAERQRITRSNEEYRVNQQRFKELYKAGLPAARKDKHNLYLDLERVGVVGMITELTGRKYFAPPLLVRPSGRLLKSSLKSISVDQDRLSEVTDRYGWQVQIAEPKMYDGGVCDTGFLGIDVRRSEFDRRDIFKQISTEIVKINYKRRGRRLIIAGEEQTFSGNIKSEPTEEQTEKLEEAMARAFHKPLVEDFTKEAKRKAAEKEQVRLLMERFGEGLGLSMGKFIFDSDSEHLSFLRLWREKL